jgi:hypothetical protein
VAGGEQRQQGLTAETQSELRRSAEKRFDSERRGPREELVGPQGVTPVFLRKSEQGVGRIVDRCHTENERVRKRLKRKRGEGADWEKRERKCRRADIFGWVAPPRFCVCRGNNGVAGGRNVCRGKKRVRGRRLMADSLRSTVDSLEGKREPGTLETKCAARRRNLDRNAAGRVSVGKGPSLRRLRARRCAIFTN